jgi:hypothetical protein
MGKSEKAKLEKAMAVHYLMTAQMRRSVQVISPIDGATVWSITPFSDDELWRRVEDLTDDEFRRLLTLWKGRREVPWETIPELRSATESILRLQTAPTRLSKRRGRHTGRLGPDPVSIELYHNFLRRLHDLLAQALSDTKPTLKPDAITRRVLADLGCRCEITAGPLKNHIVHWGTRVDEVAQRLGACVRDTLKHRGTSEKSKAAEIVLNFLDTSSSDEEPLSLRHLQRILKKTQTPRPRPDVIPPLAP